MGVNGITKSFFPAGEPADYNVRPMNCNAAKRLILAAARRRIDAARPYY